jgi:ketosteroid isomerase-like protein
MITLKRLAVSVALSFLIFCVRPAPATSVESRPSARVSEVESILARFGAALASGDFDTVRSLTVPDFVLLEEGRAYDREGTISSAAAVLSTGTFTRESSQFQTRMRGNVAWSHYRVTGQFRGADGPVALDLIESAVLERTRSGWRLVLVTTMPRISAPQ